MLRSLAAVSVASLTLLGCGNNLRSKEKVQAAILDRLQNHSGLDLKSVDVTTTQVNFNNNMAFATVAFHPKGETAVNSGMTMKYTLEIRDGQWAVTQVGDSQGHGISGGPAGAEQLPPGHPPIPAGHPPVDSSVPQAKSGEGANAPSR